MSARGIRRSVYDYLLNDAEDVFLSEEDQAYLNGDTA